MNKNRKASFFWKIVFVSFISIFLIQHMTAQNCTVNAGIPETICDNETMQLQGNLTGLISSAARWSQVGGLTVNISDPNNLTSEVAGFASGQSYTFRLSATCQDGVSVYDEVTIDVSHITIADAGIDQQSCPGAAVLSLGGNIPGSNETGQWAIQSNDGGIEGLTSSAYNSTVNLPDNISGSSTFRWSITNSNGCSSFDDVVITNPGGISPISAGPDQILSNCYSDAQTTNLSASYAGSGSGGQQGTWSLVSGPNYPTIADEHDENTEISNLVEGVYVFRWDVTGPCVSGSDEITITVPGPTHGVTGATAPNLRFCHGTTTAVLEGSIPEYTDEVGSWTQLFGPPAIITNSTNSTTTVTGLDGSSSYRFSYTITNTSTGCSSINNDIFVRFTEAPTIDVGADQILDCGTNSVTITPTVTGGTSTRYKIISGPFTQTAWTGFNSPVITINQLNQEGTYTIQFERYSVGSGCTSAFDNVNVSIANAASLANAGTDQNLACNVVETDLAGNLPTAGSGTWSQVSGPNTANIQDVYDRSSHIDNLIEGQYVFRWVISGGNHCPVQQDDVIVNVATSIPAVAAGNDKTVCHSTEVILEGNTPKPGSVGKWSVTPSTGLTFTNINDPSASVFGMQANTAYTFTWTITNQCQIESANVVITTGNVAGPSPAIAGPDQCEATGTILLTMDGNTPMVGEGLWTILSGPNTPAIADNTLPTTTVSGLIDGHYVIEWSINVPGCISTRDTLMASIVSDVTQSDAGADESVCGSQISLSANAPAANEIGYWEQVSGNSGYTVSNIYDYNATFSDLLPGRYEFAWIIEKGICPVSSDTLVLTVTEQPDVSVTASDYTVCGETTALLEANNPTAGTGAWSVIGSATNQPNIASISSPTTTVTGLATGEYNFRWTITSGPDCAAEISEVTIQVSAPAIAEANQNLCNATEAFLEGTLGTDGTWSISPANNGLPLPSISNTNAHTAVVTNMGLDQTYTFRYTIPSIYGCPSNNDDLTISTSSLGTSPDAGPDQEICLTSGNNAVMSANLPLTGSGNWNQLSGPNTANIVDPASNVTTIENLAAGIYLFEWNIDNGNCGNYRDIVRVTVNDSPSAANAGQDQVNACELDARLSANLPTVGIGTWTLISAPTASASTAVVINNPNLPNTSISNITDLGDYVFRWTTTNGTACSTSTDDVTITFTADSPNQPDAGPDQNLCDVTGTSMVGNLPVIGTGTWTQLSGPAGATISSPNNNNTSITGLTTGNYEFQWEVTSGGCSLSDIVVITNGTSSPAADASATDPDICRYEVLQLVGSNPGSGTGEWSFISGPTTPIINSPENATTNVTNTTSGIYMFRWTVSNGTCASTSDDIEVRIGDNPNTNLSVTGNTVCQNINGIVNILSSQLGVTYNLYNASALVGTEIGTGNDLSVDINESNLDVGVNTISIAANNAGCVQNLTNQATINVNAKPDASLQINGSNLCDLQDGTVTILSSEPGVNYEAFIGSTSVATGTGDGNNLIMNVLASNLSQGANTVAVAATTSNTGCATNMNSTSVINVSSPPDYQVTASGSSVCETNDASLIIQSSEPGINYEAFIGSKSLGKTSGNGSDVLMNISSDDLVVGDNKVDIIASNTNGCYGILNNKATVVVNTNPLSNLEIEDIEVCYGDSAIITVKNAETDVNYALFINDNLVANGTGNGEDLDITVPEDDYEIGNNSISVKATNLKSTCTIDMDAEPDILVKHCNIIVFNGFSPNGDGSNETFIIEGLEKYPNHKVLIFNRWGNKVYEASPYLNDWDGTNMFGVTVGGKKLPVGTYFYIIEPGNGEKPVKGYIYLNR